MTTEVLVNREIFFFLELPVSSNTVCTRCLRASAAATDFGTHCTVRNYVGLSGQRPLVQRQALAWVPCCEFLL